MDKVFMYVAVSGIIALIFTFFLIKEICTKDNKPKIQKDSMKKILGLKNNKRYIVLLIILCITTIGMYCLFLDFKIASAFSAGFFIVTIGDFINHTIINRVNNKVEKINEQNTVLDIIYTFIKIKYISSISLGVLVAALGYKILNGNFKCLASLGLGIFLAQLILLIVQKLNKSSKDDEKSIKILIKNYFNLFEGMKKDLFGLYFCTIFVTLVLGSSVSNDLSKQAIVYPMLFMSTAVIVTLIKSMYKGNIILKKYMKNICIEQIVLIIIAFILNKSLFNDFNVFTVSTFGIVMAVILNSLNLKVRKKTSCKIQSTYINITEFTNKMKNTFLSILFITIGVIASYYIMGGMDNNLNGLYGISLFLIGVISSENLILILKNDNLFNNILEFKENRDENQNILFKAFHNIQETINHNNEISISLTLVVSIMTVSCFSKIVDIDSINILDPVSIMGIFLGVSGAILIIVLILKDSINSIILTLVMTILFSTFVGMFFGIDVLFRSLGGFIVIQSIGTIIVLNSINNLYRKRDFSYYNIEEHCNYVLFANISSISNIISRITSIMIIILGQIFLDYGYFIKALIN